MSPRLSRLVPVLAAAWVCVAAFSSSASAATPCWKLLLNDWYDGAIDKTYPIPCYHQAVKHLPTDVQVYSSAREDILRALQQAIAKQRQGTTTTAPTTTASTTTTSSTPTQTDTTPTTTRGEPIPVPTTPTTTKKNRGPIGKALRDITPGGADSFPLPLLILGLLAILLVLAGVGGLVWRRYQGRSGPPPATP